MGVIKPLRGATFWRYGIIAAGLCGVVLFAATTASRTQFAQAMLAGVERMGSALGYERKVLVSGSVILRQREIENLLPQGSSNFWWRTHPKMLEMAIARHPLVSSAKVTPCQTFSLRCYQVEVQEHKIAMVAEIGDRFTAVSEQGRLLGDITTFSPLRGESEKLPEAFADLPIISGLSQDNSSPIDVQERLRRTSFVLRALARLPWPLVESVRVVGTDDLEIKFKGLALVAVFPAGAISDESEAKGNQFPEPSIDRLVGRFTKILRRVSEAGVLGSVERIDLGYRKVGVVRFRNGKERAG